MSARTNFKAPGMAPGIKYAAHMWNMATPAPQQEQKICEADMEYMLQKAFEEAQYKEDVQCEHKQEQEEVQQDKKPE